MADMSKYPELPEDDWHDFVFVLLDAICCEHCEQSPDLLWAWDHIESGHDAANVFTIRAVQYLTNAGWVMRGDGVLCPACAHVEKPTD